MDIELDYFSRSFDKHHYENAMNIMAELKKLGKDPITGPTGVHTWELYDKSFTFPRVRRYEFTQENMDMLEHFQDNLNMNISNQVNMENFLRVANTVRTNLKTKYHDGEFIDPADTDPKAVAAAAKAAAAN